MASSFLQKMKGGGYQTHTDEDAASDAIGYFEHSFQAALLEQHGDLGLQTSKEAAEGDFRRGVTLVCHQSFITLCELMGTGVNPKEEEILRIPFHDIQFITWDHLNTSVKYTKRNKAYVVLEVDNSLELEQNLNLRFVGAVKERLLESSSAIPPFSYLGMFAGPNKPKPFERKRANLTRIKQGKMPPLVQMRSHAVARHRGPEKPLPAEFSRRKALALDHIYDGVCAFTVFHASGAGGLSNMLCNNARLILDDDGLIFTNDISEVGTAVLAVTTKRMVIPFTDVIKWSVQDLHHNVTENGLSLTCADGVYFFSVEDIMHLRVSFEFFLNRFRHGKGLPAEPGTTHGRSVVGTHTLMGEVPAAEPATGVTEVLDEDNQPIHGRPAQRKKSIFGGGGPPPSLIPLQQVKGHWSKVVNHNGWLLKKGGATKTWLKRYFVLFETCQGHFLSYYAEFWDSPLYNMNRKQRNMIDLSKIVYLRAKSKHRDVPPFSFDIATIEREWTLCAESSEQLQLWLQLLASAVDEDVAIVPDDTLSFAVKARADPTDRLERGDYSTVLQISSWGVSVQKVKGSEREEVFFWCYTDFYKWSILKQHGKMALSVQIFTTGDFKTKEDFIFRSTESQAIATAIEYYIEKFMSRMHIRRELDEVPASELSGAADELQRSGSSPGALPFGRKVDSVEPVDQGDWASDGEEEDQHDLLNLNDDDDISGPAAAGAEFDGLSGGYHARDMSTVPQELLDLMAEPAPAAASSPAAATAIPGGAATTGAAAPALDARYVTLLTSQSGLLGNSACVEVYFMHEYRGSQARVSLRFRNLTSTALEGFRTAVRKADPQLRFQLSEAASVVPVGATITQVLMLECMQPFSTPPELVMDCVSGGQEQQHVVLALPVTLTHFMAPVYFPPPDFVARWDKLLGKLEATAAAPAPPSCSSYEALAARLKLLQMLPATWEEVVDPSQGIRCSVTLETGFLTSTGNRVVVGCLATVSLHTGQIRVITRTASEFVSPPFAATLARNLSLESPPVPRQPAAPF